MSIHKSDSQTWTRRDFVRTGLFAAHAEFYALC
jgi:hypothetical protein